MAATQYQILYRYLNNKNNTFVTNETTEPYEKVFEFYNSEHGIIKGDIVAEETRKEQMIVDGNLSSNPNYNMMFKYTGVKRRSKKIWKAQISGYVIRGWSGIVEKISPAGDYSGEYVLVGGNTPSSAKVVGKTKPFDRVVVASDSTVAANGLYFTTEELKARITNSVAAKLLTNDIADYTTPGKTMQLRSGGSSAYPEYITIYTGPVFVDVVPERITTAYGGAWGLRSPSGAYGSIEITEADIERCPIPAHYEESVDAPYVVCDTYERIETSPWIVFGNSNSLEDVLSKAQKLVDKFGIENVKLIKHVPIDQFVKIP